MNRSKTRELAFELLYSLEIQKAGQDEFDEQIEIFLENNDAQNEKVKKYIVDAVYGISNNLENILKIISENLSKEWELSRISKTNITLLKFATYEMMYVKLPYKVVINEVVELAKSYGDDNSQSFVNGILASIVKKNNL